MVAKRGRKQTCKPRATRALASLPPDLSQTFQNIARQKKVSVAWGIHAAAETYITEQYPLFEKA